MSYTYKKVAIDPKMERKMKISVIRSERVVYLFTEDNE